MNDLPSSPDVAAFLDAHSVQMVPEPATLRLDSLFAGTEGSAHA